MKMVGHQAPGVGFGNGANVFPVLFHKEPVIGLVPENILEPVGVVENMVAGIGEKRVHTTKMKYCLIDQLLA